MLLITLIPLTAFAAEIITDETITVSAPIDDDLYLFGADIRIESTVTGDVTAFGARVRIIGDIDGSVFISGSEVYILGDVGGSVVVLARRVVISGDVGHAVRAVASNVQIRSSSIEGDLVVAASRVSVDEDSPIGGDVRLRTGDAELLGGVGGEIRGSADELDIGGVVLGPIDVHVDRLRFMNSAVVASPIRYSSDHEFLAQREAQITGEPTRVPPDHPSLQERTGRTIVFIVFRFVWAFALGLFLLRVAPTFLRQAANSLIVRPGQSAGFGLLALLITPLTILFMLITVVGLPVALVIAAGFVLAMYASQIVVGLAIGHAILLRRWSPLDDRSGKAALALGLGLIVTLRSLPIPNWYGFVSFITVVLALGALALAINWRSVVDVNDVG